jgi:hypothetical protein
MGRCPKEISVRKSAASALVAGALAALLAVTPLGAATTKWTPAHFVHLPGLGIDLPQGYLPGLACPAAGDCVAVGSYEDGQFNVNGLVVSETGGRWRGGRTIVAPAGAASPPGLTPSAVACGAVGNCVVVGSYNDTAGNVEAFVDQEVRGAWRASVQVRLPGDALGRGQSAQLRAVVCPSVNGCVAVGSYTAATGGAVKGLVVTQSAPTWVAHAVATPPGANVDPVLTLSAVTCAPARVCVAAGTYVDDQNATHGLVVSTSASPITTELNLPLNASAFPSTTVGALTCTAPGACVVAGSYETAGGQLEGYVATSSGGAWGRASELVMPAGSRANPRVFFYGFADLACAASGNCTTGGQYIDASGNYQGFVVNEVGGAWRAATRLRLPAGAQQAGKNGGVVAVTCPALGRCRVGAAYLDAHGRYQALVEAEVHNSWSAGVTLALPTGSTSVGPDGGVYGLVCKSTRACTATGSYLNRAGAYQGFYSTLG